MDPTNEDSRIGLWYLERADTSDISDEDYKALEVIVTFIDEHLFVSDYAANGKVKRHVVKNVI